MSRKDVSLVSTFIGAVPWVTIRIQTKSGLEKRSLERSITIQATCPERAHRQLQRTSHRIHSRHMQQDNPRQNSSIIDE